MSPSKMSTGYNTFITSIAGVVTGAALWMEWITQEQANALAIGIVSLIGVFLRAGMHTETMKNAEAIAMISPALNVPSQLVRNAAEHGPTPPPPSQTE